MPLSGLETAIRSALERSNRESAEQRARIYQSARQALEAGLRKQQIADPAVIETQRHRLEDIIHHIEQEERQRQAIAEPSLDDIMRPAAEPASRIAEVAPEPARPSAAAPDPAMFGGLRAERPVDVAPPYPAAEADETALPEGLDFGAETVAKERKRGTGVFSRLLIFVILFAAIGMGAWWVYTSDVLTPPTPRDHAADQTPTVAPEDYNGAAGDDNAANPFEEHQSFNSSWHQIFAPEQIASLQPRANATADIVGEGEHRAARLTAESADADGSVAITVPAEILQQMAGKKSTIALTMKSSSDDPVSIAVTCDFGSMGTCPRFRFTVNSEPLDTLFQVSFDSAKTPSGAGKLIINPDLSGKGKGIDIFGIRAQSAQ